MNKTKTIQLMEQEQNYINNKVAQQEPDFYLIEIKNNHNEKTMTILARKELHYKRIVLDYNDLENPQWDEYERLSNDRNYIQATNIDW